MRLLAALAILVLLAPPTEVGNSLQAAPHQSWPCTMQPFPPQPAAALPPTGWKGPTDRRSPTCSAPHRPFIHLLCACLLQGIAFLKISGVTGGTLDARHAGEIDILTWSSSATAVQAVGSTGVGKVVLKDLKVRKRVDQVSASWGGGFVKETA